MFNKRNGSTILEVLIATIVVGTILTAVAATLTSSVKNSSEAEYRKVATRLAQEGLEIFRKEKYIRTWTNFKTIPDVGTNWQCMSTAVVNSGSTPAAVTGCTAITTSNPPASFYRGYQKVTNADGSVEIRLRVSWRDGANTRNVDLEQTFREVVN